MNLILVGTNHRYSDIRTRERLSFSKDDTVLALSAMIEEGIAEGAVILSTCQRVEIYAQGGDAETIRKFFLNYKESDPSYARHLYIKEGAEAVRHIFRVAGGLDSQIIGEAQILDQVRQAYIAGKGSGATTPLLNRLFERAIFAGRLVRNSTGIFKRAPSIASAAVRRAQDLTSLSGKNIFIIGSGAIAKSIAEEVAQKEASCIVVANRTFDKAEELARKIKGRAVKFEGFHTLLNQADIIFSATASRHIILKKDTFEKNRAINKKLMIFDLAFPRDIDPAITEIKDVTLFNLDDFKEENIYKTVEIARASELVTEKAERFLEKGEKIWISGSAQGQAALR